MQISNNTLNFTSSAASGKPSIAMVVQGLAYGGGEVQVVDLSLRLKARGWKVTLVSLIESTAFVDALQEHGIPVITVGITRALPDPRYIVRLARALRSVAADVVHSHMVNANILSRMSRLVYPHRLLITTAQNIKESGNDKDSAWFRELLYGLTDPLADLTTNVSVAAVDRYVLVRAAPREKICFVPNGIDTQKYAPNEETRLRTRSQMGFGDSFVFLAVGRLERQKDYPTMIRAFLDVAKDCPKAELVVAGQGSQAGYVAELIASAGLESRVRMLGLRQDVPELLSAADAFVMSSTHEGLSLALLQAGASRVPSAATDVGGNAEIVVDAVTGYTVPPSSPSKLAGAMRTLYRLPPAERRQMGARARAHVVQRFDIESVVSRWEAIYQQLLERSTSRSWRARRIDPVPT